MVHIEYSCVHVLLLDAGVVNITLNFLLQGRYIDVTNEGKSPRPGGHCDSIRSGGTCIRYTYSLKEWLPWVESSE